MPTPRCVLSSAFVLTLLLSGVVQGQEDEATQKARLFYNQGRAALYAGTPEAARPLFARAYELRPTPQIAFALGEAELGMGLFVAAANHMLPYMRMQASPTPNERKAFAEAERNVAQLYFDVNVDGTRIYIDHESIGNTPFVFQPVYTLAGRREIRATCEGFREVRQTYDVLAGHRTDVKVVLERVAQPTPAQPPLASGSADAGPASSADHPLLAPVPKEELLNARVLVTGTGAALTLAAGAFALVEGLRASSAMSDINDLHARASAQPPDACRGEATPTCREIASAQERRVDAIHLMRGALVGAAVLGGVTAATWFFWPRSKSPIGLTPQLSHEMSGLMISGVLQ